MGMKEEEQNGEYVYKCECNNGISHFELFKMYLFIVIKIIKTQMNLNGCMLSERSQLYTVGCHLYVILFTNYLFTFKFLFERQRDNEKSSIY